MFGSILVKMPELTREFDEKIGIEIINKYFVRFKGDIYIPIFNLPLLHPEVFRESSCDIGASKLADITFSYYKKYIKLRKQRQFEIKVFLPEKYGGYALYYLLQKFMINEATPEEVKIISEFLSRNIFDGKNIDMESLLHQYYESICIYYVYERYRKSVSINTPVGATPLYVLELLLRPSGRILETELRNTATVAFVNVLTSHFFDKSIQIGSTKFRFLKSIGELDFNWKNVKVISFKELYDISDAIIENNLTKTHPETFWDMLFDWCQCKENSCRNIFLSHSPILSVVGNAIDFKNKSVMFLFVMLKNKIRNTKLTEFNYSFYLTKKGFKFFVISVPFKSIKKFIYRDYGSTGMFIIEENGKTIPVLSNDVWPYWLGVGRKNIVKDYEDCDWWYKLLRKLASPENLKKAEEKTQEWILWKG